MTDMNATRPAERPQRVRWAVVGSGGIAVRTVGDLRRCDPAQVVAICSRDQARADAFAQAHDLPLAFGDFGQLCGCELVDAVYIGTPHATHFALASQALRAGKHVLCEKPLTMTAEEARVLGQLATEHGVFLMEAMWMKFSPVVRRAVELVKAGRVGEPRLLQAGLGYPVPPDGSPRFWDPALGGGALYDMGVYIIALAQLLFGGTPEVSATGTMRDDGVDLEACITFRYANGALAQLVTSITSMIPPRAWLSGRQGAIDFQEPLFSPAAIKLVTGQPPAPPTVELLEFPREGAGYVPMFRAVNEAILSGAVEHPLHPVSATVDVLALMQAVQTLLAEERDAKALA